MPRKRAHERPLKVCIQPIPAKDAHQRWAAFFSLLLQVADRLENDEGASPPTRNGEDAPHALYDNPPDFTLSIPK